MITTGVDVILSHLELCYVILTYLNFILDGVDITYQSTFP